MIHQIAQKLKYVSPPIFPVWLQAILFIITPSGILLVGEFWQTCCTQKKTESRGVIPKQTFTGTQRWREREENNQSWRTGSLSTHKVYLNVSTGFSGKSLTETFAFSQTAPPEILQSSVHGWKQLYSKLIPFLFFLNYYTI